MPAQEDLPEGVPSMVVTHEEVESESEPPIDLEPERRGQAREILIGDVVTFVETSGPHEVSYNSLVLINFEPEVRCPKLSVVHVKHGNGGVAVKRYVSHEYHKGRESFFWRFKSAQPLEDSDAGR